MYKLPHIFAVLYLHNGSCYSLARLNNFSFIDDNVLSIQANNNICNYKLVYMNRLKSFAISRTLQPCSNDILLLSLGKYFSVIWYELQYTFCIPTPFCIQTIPLNYVICFVFIDNSSVKECIQLLLVYFCVVFISFHRFYWSKERFKS